MATEHVCDDCTLPPATRDRIRRIELLRSNADGHRRCAVLDDQAADALNAQITGDVCTGAGTCAAAIHVHGCYADLDGRCDYPGDHAGVTP